MPMKVRYTVIDGELVAENRGGVRSLYVPDSLGTTRALLNSTQTQTDTFVAWPYGEPQHLTGTNPTPFTFVGTNGYYTDNPTKTYVRARVVEPPKGRWVTSDAGLGLQAGSSRYEYVGNTPTTLADPSGRYATSNCNPVVYSCYRNFTGIGIKHTFFWINYPCNPDDDRTIGYGPWKSYPDMNPPQQPADWNCIVDGSCRCTVTNCGEPCVTKMGARIREGDPKWDPKNYRIYGSKCWSFSDAVYKHCGCKETGKGRFNPPPRKPTPPESTDPGDPYGGHAPGTQHGGVGGKPIRVD